MTRVSLLDELSTWLFRGRVLAALLLIAATVGSALSVVYVSHVNRQLYSSLQELQKQQDYLESEYEKLLLEQSAWSDYSRIELLSRGELNMRTAPIADVVLVEI